MNRDTIILKRYILSGEKAEICSDTLDGTMKKKGVILYYYVP